MTDTIERRVTRLETKFDSAEKELERERMDRRRVYDSIDERLSNIEKRLREGFEHVDRKIYFFMGGCAAFMAVVHILFR